MFLRIWASVTVFMAVVGVLSAVSVAAAQSYGEVCLLGEDAGAKVGCLPAPTGLSASDGTYTDKIRLQWNSVVDATGYRIWRNTSDNLGSAALTATRTWTAFEDKSVAACTTYWYWVQATGVCGQGDISVVANSGFRAMPAPANLRASDQTYPDKVRLEWNAVPGATGYEIWRSTSDTIVLAAQVATRTWTAYEDKSVTACTLYYYWVRATGACGTGDFSASDDGSAFGLPVAPTGLNASNGAYTDKVRLQWNAVAGATGYEIWRNTSDSLGSATQIATRTWTAFEDKAVSPDTLYYYWVRALGACGTGDFSTSDVGFRLLATPTGLSASDDLYADKIRVQWGTVSGATNYQIWRNTSNVLGSATQVGTRTWTAFEDRSVARATTYWYWVRATGAYCTGGFSASDSGSRTGAGDQETILLPDNVPLTMVWIPSGTFWMGRYSGEQDSDSNEDPRHQVTVPGFWMGKSELTKAQWTAVMGTTPWSGQEYVLEDSNSPAVYVSWNNAQSFLTALNSYSGLTFRLPSEAEWEYACRAGTTTRFYWGDDPSYTVGNAYCWWIYNAGDVNERYAHVVGQKTANLWGLFDMSGNVWEWCEDDWHNDYAGAPANGSAWVDSPRGSIRLGRGGSWFYYGNDCRSANRNYIFPSDTYPRVGFRLSR